MTAGTTKKSNKLRKTKNPLQLQPALNETGSFWSTRRRLPVNLATKLLGCQPEDTMGSNSCATKLMKQQPRQEAVLEGLPIGSKAQRQATAADDHGDFLDILLGVQFISKRPDILKYLNERDRAIINKRGSICVFNPGEHLFRQADHHSGIFIIESGLVKVYYSSPAGKQATLAFWDAGNFVGGPDVFGTFDHIWSGIAVRRTSTVFISGNDLRALADRKSVV